MSNAKLLVHAGGTRRSRTELAVLPTPEPTRSWRPVAHHELVAALIDGLSANGIGVVSDEYATSGVNAAKLFGIMRLAAPGLDTGEYRMALGIRASNDKSMSLNVVAGVNVMCCDNLALYSDGPILLKRRHTSRLRLASIVPNAIDQFVIRAETFKVDIERMRNLALPDSRAKELIHDAFTGTAPVLPLRCMPAVSRLYFDSPEQRDLFPGRDLWGLLNSFNEAEKCLKDVPRHNAQIRLGKFFGRVVRCKPSVPVAVIDGIEIFSDN